MNKTCKNISILYLCCFVSSLIIPAGLFAQKAGSGDHDMVRGSSLTNITPVEKLLVYHDRDLYLEGDTIWLKIINTEPLSGKTIKLSSTAYVELLGPDDKMFTRQKIKLTNEAGHGWIRIPDNIMSGNYYLRTYTSWMKNYHPSGYTYTLITIINPFIPLYFSQYETGKEKRGEIVVEVFPEGGHIISGIENRVVFNLSGMIANKDSLKGEIRDEKDSLVTQVKFISTENGYFSLLPLETKEYYLSIMLNGTQHKKVPIPQAQKGGYIMDWTENHNLLTFNIRKHPLSTGDMQQLWLTGKAAGLVLFSVPAGLENGTAEVAIGTDRLKEGINEFILTDMMGNRLYSRIIYRPVRDHLSVEIDLENTRFRCRDNIQFSVNVRDMSDRAVKSDLSASVYLVDMPSGNEEINPGKMDVMDPAFFRQWMNIYGNGGIGIDDETYDVALSAGYLVHSARNPGSDDSSSKLQFYPELAGPAISGSILESTSGQPAGNRLIICSSMGSASLFQVFKTGEDGKFRFAVAEDQKFNDLVIRSLDQDIHLDIKIENPYSDQYQHMTLPALQLDEGRAQYIEQLSISKQVREAYQNLDEGIYPVDNPGRTAYFYGEPSETVNLESFIKLPVMEEIFREIVKTVIVYRKAGAFKLGIIDNSTREIIGENPMFLLDGVPLFDHGRILEIDPALIRTIHIVDSKYFIGDLEMDGIIDIRSRQGGFEDFDLPSSTVPYKFQSYANYDKPPTGVVRPHEEETGRQLPDYRSMLYWNPKIITDQDGIAEISFNASDVPGYYRIVVEGISADGQTGKSTKVFEIVLTD